MTLTFAQDSFAQGSFAQGDVPIIEDRSGGLVLTVLGLLLVALACVALAGLYFWITGRNAQHRFYDAQATAAAVRTPRTPGPVAATSALSAPVATNGFLHRDPEGWPPSVPDSAPETADPLEWERQGAPEPPQPMTAPPSPRTAPPLPEPVPAAASHTEVVVEQAPAPVPEVPAGLTIPQPVGPGAPARPSPDPVLAPRARSATPQPTPPARRRPPATTPAPTRNRPPVSQSAPPRDPEPTPDPAPRRAQRSAPSRRGRGRPDIPEW